MVSRMSFPTCFDFFGFFYVFVQRDLGCSGAGAMHLAGGWSLDRVFPSADEDVHLQDATLSAWRAGGVCTNLAGASSVEGVA